MILGPEQNGDILRSKKDWMRVLADASSTAVNKAIAAAVASGLLMDRRANGDTHAQGWQTELPLWPEMPFYR